jgi:hypothetical protein
MAAAKDGKKTIKIWFSRVVYDESLRVSFPNASFTRATFIQDWHPVEIDQAQTATLDWFPYLSYTNELEQSDDQFKAGLDVVWRPRNNIQFTGALNPDYGQVESDDLVINFTAFETFRSEKRPFFSENQALFTGEVPNGDRVVHTRRIGAASDAGDEGITDVDLAGKLSYYGEALDFGLFAVTEDNTRHSEGRNFVATRVQSKIDRVTLGHRFTYVDHPTLDRDAMIQALDFDWQISPRTGLQGQVIYSDINQRANPSNGGQRLDQSDYAAWFQWDYSPSDAWQHKLVGHHYGNEFDMNDMGFMTRNDQNIVIGSTQYDTLQYAEQSALLSSFSKIEYGYEENTEGDRLALWAEFNRHLVYRSTREIDLKAGYQASGWDDRITRGNGLYALPAQYWGSVMYESQRGNRFAYSVELFTETSGTDAPSVGVKVEPQLYLSESLTLTGKVLYQRFREWLLWDYPTQQLAAFEADRYVMDLGINWYPSSKQEVRVKFQWAAVSADAVDGYRLSESGDLVESGTAVSDFSLSDTVLQIRYRYELAPLSNIYLVYNRGGFFFSDEHGDSPWELIQEGWREKQVETIILKIRYRF